MDSLDCQPDNGRRLREWKKRNTVLCPSRENYSVDENITCCNHCGQYFQFCCVDDRFYNPETDICCHAYHLIFTDGACLGNGHIDATAGLGVCIGTNSADQWSIVVDDRIDYGGRRTSQRAELLAAIEGVKRMMENRKSESFHSRLKRRGMVEQWIITTDSEYVAKGMTEWMPKWKQNNWRTSKGSRPSNLDLFVKLEEIIFDAEAEGKGNIEVGFWHVPREYNKTADNLAKSAAAAARQPN